MNSVARMTKNNSLKGLASGNYKKKLKRPNRQYIGGRALAGNNSRKNYFQGQKVTVLTEKNYQQARGSQHLKFMFVFFNNMVLNFALPRPFFCEY